MTKLDINGNTVSKNENYLISVIRSMKKPEYEIDSANRYMVSCGDGGSIRFFGQDYPRMAEYLDINGGLII